MTQTGWEGKGILSKRSRKSKESKSSKSTGHNGKSSAGIVVAEKIAALPRELIAVFAAVNYRRAYSTFLPPQPLFPILSLHGAIVVKVHVHRSTKWDGKVDILDGILDLFCCGSPPEPEGIWLKLRPVNGA